MKQVNITFKDKLGVFFWRNMMMPVIAGIGGKKYPEGIVVKEFAYGSLKDEKLDFIAPKKETKKQIAIVHIHGGAWIAGSKGNFYSKPLTKFSNEGYPIFSLNYPLAPEQQHPFMLRSLLKALVWIKKKYPEYKEIHLIGDSAGGNLIIGVTALAIIKGCKVPDGLNLIYPAIALSRSLFSPSTILCLDDVYLGATFLSV